MSDIVDLPLDEVIKLNKPKKGSGCAMFILKMVLSDVSHFLRLFSGPRKDFGKAPRQGVALNARQAPYSRPQEAYVRRTEIDYDTPRVPASFWWENASL